jgi:hypothetical protein
MLLVAAMLSLALPLVNCSSNGSSGFDPTSMMDDLFASQKKPLPGDRKPLFPEGTPGIQTGVPPDLVKGYQAAPPSDAAASDDSQKPKSKAKPKTAAAPPPQQPPPAAQPTQPN